MTQEQLSRQEFNRRAKGKVQEEKVRAITKNFTASNDNVKRFQSQWLVPYSDKKGYPLAKELRTPDTEKRQAEANAQAWAAVGMTHLGSDRTEAIVNSTFKYLDLVYAAYPIATGDYVILRSETPAGKRSNVAFLSEIYLRPDFANEDSIEYCKENNIEDNFESYVAGWAAAVEADKKASIPEQDYYSSLYRNEYLTRTRCSLNDQMTRRECGLYGFKLGQLKIGKAAQAEWLKWQVWGNNSVYLVVNSKGRGAKAEQIQDNFCYMFIVECDLQGQNPEDWKARNLPEPTFVMWSGGKSYHWQYIFHADSTGAMPRVTAVNKIRQQLIRRAGADGFRLSNEDSVSNFSAMAIRLPFWAKLKQQKKDASGNLPKDKDGKVQGAELTGVSTITNFPKSDIISATEFKTYSQKDLEQWIENNGGWWGSFTGRPDIQVSNEPTIPEVNNPQWRELFNGADGQMFLKSIESRLAREDRREAKIAEREAKIAATEDGEYHEEDDSEDDEIEVIDFDGKLDLVSLLSKQWQEWVVTGVPDGEGLGSGWKQPYALLHNLNAAVQAAEDMGVELAQTWEEVFEAFCDVNFEGKEEKRPAAERQIDEVIGSYFDKSTYAYYKNAVQRIHWLTGNQSSRSYSATSSNDTEQEVSTEDVGKAPTFTGFDLVSSRVGDIDARELADIGVRTELSLTKVRFAIKQTSHIKYPYINITANPNAVGTFDAGYTVLVTDFNSPYLKTFLQYFQSQSDAIYALNFPKIKSERDESLVEFLKANYKEIKCVVTHYDVQRGVRNFWQKQEDAIKSDVVGCDRYFSNVFNPNREALLAKSGLFIKSGMGTGKSFTIKQLKAEKALGEFLVAVTYRERLSHQNSDMFELATYNDKEKSQNQRWEAAYATGGISMTLDTLAKTKDGSGFLGKFDLSKLDGGTIVLDEIESISQYLIDSPTLANTRKAAFGQLTALCQHAIATGGRVIFADGNLTQMTIDYWVEHLGLENRFVTVENTFKLVASENRVIKFDENKNSVVSQAIALHRSESTTATFVMTDTMKAGKRNHGSTRSLLSIVGCDAIPVDSKSHVVIDDKGHGADIEGFVAVQRAQNQSAFVAVSPSVESGENILERFDGIFGIYMGVMGSKNILQQLERVRNDSPRTIYLPEKAQHTPIAIIDSQEDSNKINQADYAKNLAAPAKQIGGLHNGNIPDFTREDIAAPLLAYYVKLQKRSTYEREEFRLNVLADLKENGYQIEWIKDDLTDKGIIEEITLGGEIVRQKEVADIASADLTIKPTKEKTCDLREWNTRQLLTNLRKTSILPDTYSERFVANAVNIDNSFAELLISNAMHNRTFKRKLNLGFALRTEAIKGGFATQPLLEADLREGFRMQKDITFKVNPSSMEIMNIANTKLKIYEFIAALSNQSKLYELKDKEEGVLYFTTNQKLVKDFHQKLVGVLPDLKARNFPQIITGKKAEGYQGKDIANFLMHFGFEVCKAGQKTTRQVLPGDKENKDTNGSNRAHTVFAIRENALNIKVWDAWLYQFKAGIDPQRLNLITCFGNSEYALTANKALIDSGNAHRLDDDALLRDEWVKATAAPEDKKLAYEYSERTQEVYANNLYEMSMAMAA